MSRLEPLLKLCKLLVGTAVAGQVVQHAGCCCMQIVCAVGGDRGCGPGHASRRSELGSSCELQLAEQFFVVGQVV